MEVLQKKYIYIAPAQSYPISWDMLASARRFLDLYHLYPCCCVQVLQWRHRVVAALPVPPLLAANNTDVHITVWPSSFLLVSSPLNIVVAARRGWVWL